MLALRYLTGISSENCTACIHGTVRIYFRGRTHAGIIIIKYANGMHLAPVPSATDPWVKQQLKNYYTQCSDTCTWVNPLKFLQKYSCIYCTVPKFRVMYSQKWNCADSFPVPIFMFLWVIYIFPGSISLFGCRKIDKLILGIYKSPTDTWMWKLGDRTL